MIHKVDMDKRIKFVASEGLSVPVDVVRVTKFTEESVKEFTTAMQKAFNNEQSFIPIVIDSYGGYVDSFMAMYELIKISPVPVATICIGKAMSAGAALLTCGTDGMRYVAPYSRVMVHDMSTGMWGKEVEIQANAKESERLKKHLFHIMAKNCGQSKNYFMDLLLQKTNVDWYLTPQEAVKHNIANHIGIPRIETVVSVETNLVK